MNYLETIENMKYNGFDVKIDFTDKKIIEVFGKDGFYKSYPLSKDASLDHQFRNIVWSIRHIQDVKKNKNKTKDMVSDFYKNNF